MDPERYARHDATLTPGRFRLAVGHGEGRTAYYVVDAEAPEAEQPAIVASFSDRDGEPRKGASARWLACDFINRHNAK